MQPFGIIQTESGHGLEAWERRSMALLCDVPDCNKPSDCVSPKADSVETFWPQLAACFFGVFWGFFFPAPQQPEHTRHLHSKESEFRRFHRDT